MPSGILSLVRGACRTTPGPARHARFGAPAGGAGRRMRIVVTGATGNVGHERARRARRRPAGDRDRRPGAPPAGRRRARRRAGCRRRRRRTPLEEHFRGADAVIHLAWLIQPSRDERDARGRQRARLARACSRPRRRAGVGALVHASSSAPTRPGPTTARSTSPGRRTARRPRSTRATRRPPSARSTRSRPRIPELRVVRLRPALIFKREAASGIRRLFAGPLLPSPLVRPEAAARAARCRAACASRPCTRDDVGGGLPARGAPTSARRAPTTSPPSRCSTRRRSARCSARASSRSRPRRSARPPT